MSDINITKITPPKVGWPVFYHCSDCKRTEIVLVPWSAKPTEGDYFLIEMCIHPVFMFRHIPYKLNGYTIKETSND
jgi:hypothetical protein